MSANYEIPGAPGFSIPGGADMSPEERDAYLLRLRFGPSLFKSGQNFSSAGGDDNTTPGPTNAPQPGVMNPAVMRGFLQSANTSVAPSKTYSEQMLQKILGPEADASGATPSEAQPTNEEEYNKAYPPNVYDLPEDRARYEQYAKSWGGSRAYEEQQGRQKVAEENAKSNADLRNAQTEKANAQADLTREQTEHPERFGKAGAGGAGSRIQQVLGLAGSSPQASPSTPPTQSAAAGPPLGQGLVRDPQNPNVAYFGSPEGPRFLFDPRTGKWHKA